MLPLMLAPLFIIRSFACRLPLIVVPWPTSIVFKIFNFALMVLLLPSVKFFTLMF